MSGVEPTSWPSISTAPRGVLVSRSRPTLRFLREAFALPGAGCGAVVATGLVGVGVGPVAGATGTTGVGPVVGAAGTAGVGSVVGAAGTAGVGAEAGAVLGRAGASAPGVGTRA